MPSSLLKYSLNVANILGLKCSPSQSIFRDTIQLEQKLSRIIFIVMKASPVCVYAPILINTYSTVYFTTDLGADAFELIYPLRYVSNTVESYKKRT